MGWYVDMANQLDWTRPWSVFIRITRVHEFFHSVCAHSIVLCCCTHNMPIYGRNMRRIALAQQLRVKLRVSDNLNYCAEEQKWRNRSSWPTHKHKPLLSSFRCCKLIEADANESYPYHCRMVILKPISRNAVDIDRYKVNIFRGRRRAAVNVREMFVSTIRVIYDFRNAYHTFIIVLRYSYLFYENNVKIKRKR